MITMEDIEQLLESAGLEAQGWQKRVLLNLLNSDGPFDIRGSSR